MSYTVENGNFEGRSRATGAYGNESGQAGRRGASGEAEKANKRAMEYAAAQSAPSGPFKSPNYDATAANIAKMIGMAIPGPGLLKNLGGPIVNDDPYGAFGIPKDWSTYSQRDIDPLGGNPRGNIGGRDVGAGSLSLAQRQALLLAALRRQQARSRPPVIEPGVPKAYPIPAIGDQVPGLPSYGTTPGKAGGYGGLGRPAPMPYPDLFA